VPLDVVSIPAIEHFEQDIINLLGIGLENDRIRPERVKLPFALFLCHGWQAEGQHRNCQNFDEYFEAFSQHRTGWFGGQASKIRFFYP
jgi:hypothetical protein